MDGARGLGVMISRRRRNPHPCARSAEHFGSLSGTFVPNRDISIRASSLARREQELSGVMLGTRVKRGDKIQFLFASDLIQDMFF